MASITVVQGTAISAFAAGAFASGTLSCTWTTTQGNLGVAFVACAGGVGPSGVGDSGGQWTLITTTPTNVGICSLWVNPYLPGGTNTVTAPGLTGFPTGSSTVSSPSIALAEINWPSTALGISAFQALLNSFNSANGGAGGFISPSRSATTVVIAGVYDTAGFNSATPDHTWSVSTSTASIIAEFHENGGTPTNNTGFLAISVPPSLSIAGTTTATAALQCIGCSLILNGAN